jgi:tRNA(adenine34) deaminase
MQTEKYMRMALDQANLASLCQEVPIGAVVVSAEGQVLGQSYNQVEQRHSQAAHAELLALQQAGNNLGDWRLSGCTIYVTLEPCAMCMSAILLSRVSKVVFASGSPLYGYRVDKRINFALYNCPIVVQEGILEQEATALLRAFFKTCREKDVDGC